jgi:hypothetical protein
MEAAEMNRLSTLPSAREQARQALLLLGVPAPARLVVQVHRALFDGDLDMSGVAALLRAERLAASPVVCHGLTAELSPMHVALAEWPLERRIVTPATAKADELSAYARIRQFVAIRPGASRSAHELLQSFALAPESISEAAVAAEAPIREAAVRLAQSRTTIEQLFGVPVVPHPRSGQ